MKTEPSSTPNALSEERLDQRMSREKLESAIAWFSGEKKPSNRRVTRGDLRSMLLELQQLRALRREPGEVVEALRNLVKEFDDMDEHRPLHAGCIQCTEGATPDRYNTGPCAYHKAKTALSGLLCCAPKNCSCDKCNAAFDHLRLPSLASSQAGKCDEAECRHCYGTGFRMTHPAGVREPCFACTGTRPTQEPGR